MSDASPPPDVVHPAELSDDDLLAGCRELKFKGSGPGGQRRNKVETGVRLEHAETGLRAEATERRFAGENRTVALKRLRLTLAVDHRLPRRRDDLPAALWIERTRAGRILIGENHADVPALLCGALDLLAATGGDFPPVAEDLGLTVSQLMKLLKFEPEAWARVKTLRAASGLPSIK